MHQGSKDTGHNREEVLNGASTYVYILYSVKVKTGVSDMLLAGNTW
jgi:hypothetical protein